MNIQSSNLLHAIHTCIKGMKYSLYRIHWCAFHSFTSQSEIIFLHNILHFTTSSSQNHFTLEHSVFKTVILVVRLSSLKGEMLFEIYISLPFGHSEGKRKKHSGRQKNNPTIKTKTKNNLYSSCGFCNCRFRKLYLKQLWNVFVIKQKSI